MPEIQTGEEVMPHDLYMPEFADKLKHRAGMKWRPSNGTEGDIFMESWCAKCKRDINFDCEIIAKTMVFSFDDERYPKEWQYGEDGQPKCTAYESA